MQLVVWVSPPLVLSVRHNSTAGCGNYHIHLYTGIMQLFGTVRKGHFWACLNTNFPYGNPDWAAHQPVVTQENCLYSSLPTSVYSTHS